MQLVSIIIIPVGFYTIKGFTEKYLDVSLVMKRKLNFFNQYFVYSIHDSILHNYFRRNISFDSTGVCVCFVVNITNFATLTPVKRQEQF